MKKNLKNKKGFTLIELIVVIGILAVLAMILVPTVSGYMERSKKSVGNANARSCYSAYQAVETMFESGIITAGEKPTVLTELGYVNCTVEGGNTIKYSKDGIVGTYQFKS